MLNISSNLTIPSKRHNMDTRIERQIRPWDFLNGNEKSATTTQFKEPAQKGSGPFDILRKVTGGALAPAGGALKLAGQGISLAGAGDVLPARKLKARIMRQLRRKRKPRKKQRGSGLNPKRVIDIIVNRMIPLTVNKLKSIGAFAFPMVKPRKLLARKLRAIMRKKKGGLTRSAFGAQTGGFAFTALLPLIGTLAGPILETIGSIFKPRGKGKQRGGILGSLLASLAGPIIGSIGKLFTGSGRSKKAMFKKLIKKDLVKMLKAGQKAKIEKMSMKGRGKVGDFFKSIGRPLASFVKDILVKMPKVRKAIRKPVKFISKLVGNGKRGRSLKILRQFIPQVLRKVARFSPKMRGMGKRQRGGFLAKLGESIFKAIRKMIGLGRQRGGFRFLGSLAKSIFQGIRRMIGVGKINQKRALQVLAKDIKKALTGRIKRAQMGSGFFDFLKGAIKTGSKLIKKAKPFIKKAKPILGAVSKLPFIQRLFN